MPNKYSFKLTPLADADMDEAALYISENLHNPKAALDLLGAIDEAIEQICTFPYAQPDCTCFLITNAEFRHIQVNNYTLVYRIKEDTKTLHILFFRYAKMDLIRIFTNLTESNDKQ